MPIRVAPLVVFEADRATLEGLLRSPSLKSGLARRARIVLLAAEAVSNTEIAERVGVSRPTVLLWQGRYASGGWTRWSIWNARDARVGSKGTRWWRRR